MKKIIIFFVFFSFIEAYAAVYLKVIYIADHTENCNGQKCLLVRDSPTDIFQVFDKKIEGFNYQEGFEYCLLIEVQTQGVSEPAIPTDSSQIKYVLSEIKSKIKINSSVTTTKIATSISDSSKWILYKLKTKDGTKTFSVSKAYLQFDVKNNIAIGNTDCNDFTASFSLDTSLIFENIVTTKMNCKKYSSETAFLNALNSTNKFKVRSNLLYLYNDKKLVAIFTRKK